MAAQDPAAARLECQWLVGDTPTELEVQFGPGADAGTVVKIEHRGWEQFGLAGTGRRNRNNRVWSGVLARYLAVCWPAPPGLSEEAR